MFKVSGNFQQALHRTLILIITALLAAFMWAYALMASGNLLMVVFALLTAVRISGFASLEMRLQILLGMMTGALLLQYIVSATGSLPLLNILLPAAVCGIILKFMPSGSAWVVLLSGLLAYSAPGGVYAAVERIPDIMLAGAAALLVSCIAGKSPEAQTNDPGKPLAGREAFLVALTVFCAVFLYRFLAIKQGVWIVLTIVFIYMIRKPGELSRTLAQQRIFAVPTGIILGGLYSCTAVALNYRWVYLMPLIGAVGFFMLYYRHDFFMFSLFFMFAFTVYADWMNGPFRQFDFLQLLLARSLATVIGTAVLLFIEKSAAVAWRKVPET